MTVGSGPEMTRAHGSRRTGDQGEVTEEHVELRRDVFDHSERVPSLFQRVRA